MWIEIVRLVGRVKSFAEQHPNNKHELFGHSCQMSCVATFACKPWKSHTVKLPIVETLQSVQTRMLYMSSARVSIPTIFMAIAHSWENTGYTSVLFKCKPDFRFKSNCVTSSGVSSPHLKRCFPRFATIFVSSDFPAFFLGAGRSPFC